MTTTEHSEQQGVMESWAGAGMGLLLANKKPGLASVRQQRAGVEISVIIILQHGGRG